MSTVEVPMSYVAFIGYEASQRIRNRARVLSRRRLVDAVDAVELQMLVSLLTGECNVISTSNVWRAVLLRHHHDTNVPLDDTEGNWQHEPYATYRQETLTVYRRLEATAAGEVIVEDELVRYPDSEQEETANKQRLDALLRWAAEQVNAIYSNAGYLSGEALLQLLEFEARHAIEHNFAQQWFDDASALGCAIMEQPILGGSPFGGHKSQVALIRALAGIVYEATVAFDDDTRVEEERAAYGHRVALFWPLLKGIVHSVANNTNSPAVGLDETLVETIDKALVEGLRVYIAADRLDLVTRGWSENGREVRSTPTSDIVEQLRNRVAQERDMQAQFAALIR